MKSTGASASVATRTASANRSSQVGSIAAAQREVGREPVAVGRSRRSSDAPSSDEDVARVAGDELHPAASIVLHRGRQPR